MQDKQGDRRKRPEPHRTVHHEQPAGAGIRKAGAPDILTHTRDWANSGCYFGMYSNGQNFDLYLYIDEKSVFRNFSSALLTALIFYLICVAVLQTLRRRSMKLAEQQKREQEQKYHAQLEEQNRKLELASGTRQRQTAPSGSSCST